ncbi:MAG: hypothetical protein ACLFTT_16905 [Candidatus Hydrogenedentota bacterium]
MATTKKTAKPKTATAKTKPAAKPTPKKQDTPKVPGVRWQATAVQSSANGMAIPVARGYSLSRDRLASQVRPFAPYG